MPAEKYVHSSHDIAPSGRGRRGFRAQRKRIVWTLAIAVPYEPITVFDRGPVSEASLVDADSLRLDLRQVGLEFDSTDLSAMRLVRGFRQECYQFVVFLLRRFLVCIAMFLSEYVQQTRGFSWDRHRQFCTIHSAALRDKTRRSWSLAQMSSKSRGLGTDNTSCVTGSFHAVSRYSASRA